VISVIPAKLSEGIHTAVPEKANAIYKAIHTIAIKSVSFAVFFM